MSTTATSWSRVYEEVVGLKENVAYGPAQSIELKPCGLTILAVPIVTIIAFSELKATQALQ